MNLFSPRALAIAITCIVTPIVTVSHARRLPQARSTSDVPAQVAVQVERTLLREQPSYLARTIAELRVGQVVVREGSADEGDWIPVTYQGLRGYLHKSATGYKTTLHPGMLLPGSNTQDEPVMAGKGFDVDDEVADRRDQPDLVDYAALQELEAMAAADFAVQETDWPAFIERGRLTAGSRRQ